MERYKADLFALCFFSVSLIAWGHCFFRLVKGSHRTGNCHGFFNGLLLMEGVTVLLRMQLVVQGTLLGVTAASSGRPSPGAAPDVLQILCPLEPIEKPVSTDKGWGSGRGRGGQHFPKLLMYLGTEPSLAGSQPCIQPKP